MALALSIPHFVGMGDTNEGRPSVRYELEDLMGRTLPSTTQLFQSEEAAFGNFKRALSKMDRLAFEELFRKARFHLAAAQYAAHALPMETFLLAMALEMQKEINGLRIQVEARVGQPGPVEELDEQAPVDEVESQEVELASESGEMPGFDAGDPWDDFTDFDQTPGWKRLETPKRKRR